MRTTVTASSRPHRLAPVRTIWNALFRSVGLSSALLQQLDGMISYRRFLRLLDLSAVRSGDAFFGLRLGLRQGVSVFGPLLYLIRNAASVGEALGGLRGHSAHEPR